MSHSTDRAHPEAGFGLTELLVSLVLLALLSLLIFDGIAAGGNVWRTTAVRAKAAEDIQTAQAILRSRMVAIYPATRFDASQPYPDFGGTSTRISFLAPPSDASGPAALRRYALYVDRAGDLVLASTNDLLGLYPEDYHVTPTIEILLRSVAGININYLDDHGRWQSTWQQMPILPRLMRVRVVFPAGDGRWWPTFLVSAATTIDSGCVNYNHTGRCGGRV